ncbi:hypothetical protein [Lactococcus protaetiae]|uniref:LXG domain-containing protein n=1 Tax=Lactococcus protaetiae TaxID=2592653 RepID=A0A514Z6F7_9LACT|nr:hypothetical protein [Lactococcus protaetiae]QDK70169.1 hypothetical protein FLP15_01970 [Lactococcus protaetiae]
MIFGIDGNQIQYERGLENVRRLMPPRVEHDRSICEQKFKQEMDNILNTSKNKLQHLKEDFETGASGKGADKIKEGFDNSIAIRF